MSETTSARKKNYIVDTNVLIENPQSLVTLRNGAENEIYIPYQVLKELDGLKNSPKLRHIVSTVVGVLAENIEHIHFIEHTDSDPFASSPDSKILNEIVRAVEQRTIDDPILVTNDRILQLRARLARVKSEEFRDSKPFESESQRYTGFVEDDARDKPANSFSWRDGRPVMHAPGGERPVAYTHEVWGVKPRSAYQNLCFELMLAEHVDLVSIQSEAGYGKTYLALAAALYEVLEAKRFKKVYVVKPTIEIGAKMGFLPGDIAEKMEPYMRYIGMLVEKLHDQRNASKLFLNAEDAHKRYNPKKFEILPLAYIRGMNIENAFVIIDETQNLSRNEVRALLTRMGEGVKCVCLGDTNQVDNPYLNESNNGLNWIVRKCKGFPNYAHMVLKGDKSRGPITDIVLKSKL